MQQKLYREELLQIFPQKLRQRIEESVTFKNLTEIRLRADLPVLIETTQENYFLKKEEAAEKRRAIAKEEDNWILSPEQLKLIFEKISQYSVQRILTGKVFQVYYFKRRTPGRLMWQILLQGGRKAADKTYFFNQSSCSKRSHWMRRVHCTKTF